MNSANGEGEEMVLSADMQRTGPPYMVMSADSRRARGGEEEEKTQAVAARTLLPADKLLAP